MASWRLKMPLASHAYWCPTNDWTGLFCRTRRDNGIRRESGRILPTRPICTPVNNADLCTHKCTRSLMFLGYGWIVKRFTVWLRDVIATRTLWRTPKCGCARAKTSPLCWSHEPHSAGIPVPWAALLYAAFWYTRM